MEIVWTFLDTTKIIFYLMTIDPQIPQCATAPLVSKSSELQNSKIYCGLFQTGFHSHAGRQYSRSLLLGGGEETSYPHHCPGPSSPQPHYCMISYSSSWHNHYNTILTVTKYTCRRGVLLGKHCELMKKIQLVGGTKQTNDGHTISRRNNKCMMEIQLAVPRTNCISIITCLCSSN